MNRNMTRSVMIKTLSFVVAASLVTPLCAQEISPGQVLITNVDIFDGVGDEVAAGQDVLIEGNLIKCVGKVCSTRSILKSFGYFFSPNTLESWLCRWCKTHPGDFPNFTYFQKLCASAIQVNMVNTSTKNTFDGTAEHTVEALNEKYKEGYRFDIDAFAAHKPAELSCGREHFKLVKR